MLDVAGASQLLDSTLLNLRPAKCEAQMRFVLEKKTGGPKHTGNGVFCLVGQLAHGLAAQALLLCVPDQGPAQAVHQRQGAVPHRWGIAQPAGLHLAYEAAGNFARS